MKKILTVISFIILSTALTVSYADTVGDCLNNSTFKENECLSECGGKPNDEQLKCQNKCFVDRNARDKACQSSNNSSLNKINTIPPNNVSSIQELDKM